MMGEPNVSLSNFYSVSIRDLQVYVENLERENDQLRHEVRTASKLISVLEEIAKSCQRGYSALRNIDINKHCDCNEHLNEELRKSLHDIVIESNMYLDKYDRIRTRYDNGLDTEDDDEDDDIIDITDKEDSPYTPIQKLAAEKEMAHKDKQVVQKQLKLQHEGMPPGACCNLCCPYPGSNHDLKHAFCSYCSLNANKADPPADNKSHLEVQKDTSLIQRSPGNNQHRCHVGDCDAIFALQANLKLHQEKHHPVQNNTALYHCSQCNVNFSLKVNLEQHMINHMGESINK